MKEQLGASKMTGENRAELKAKCRREVQLWKLK